MVAEPEDPQTLRSGHPARLVVVPVCWVRPEPYCHWFLQLESRVQLRDFAQ
jgi:hypothetical protein